MDTKQKIALKKQELDFLRLSVQQTLGPNNNLHGAGFGLVAAGFALGVMVERWGWRPTLGSAFSLNRLVNLMLPAAAPVLAMLHD